VPLAVLARGLFLTGELSDHSMTNIAIVKAFGRRVAYSPDGLVRISALARRTSRGKLAT